MTKFYFWSLPLHADNFSPKAVRWKSSYPHDCYFYGQKPYRHGIFFLSVTAHFFIDFRLSIALIIIY